MKKHLTEATVSKLNADPEKRLEIHDTLVPGLRLRISRKGNKSWSLMYKVAGVAMDGSRGPNRRMTLGQYPLIGLKDARDKGAMAKELADQGVDPVDHRNDVLTSRLERQFSRVVSSFIELHAKPHTKNWRDTKHLLEQTLNPVWGSKDIQAIDRASIHKLLDSISEKKGASHAREVRKHLSIMFNWCADRGICQFNPMAGMRRRDLKYSPRERVLELEEIKAIWQASKEVGYPFGPIVQLLILSGQRRSEIANLKHSWITDDFIEIPASEYKTGVAQIVPLTQTIKNILMAQTRWNGGEYVFSTTNGRTPSSGFSKAKKRFDTLSNIENWTFHDIRRSVATHMARAGVIQEHIERVLGHVITGVAGTYNRYSYVEEKLKALLIWQRVF